MISFEQFQEQDSTTNVDENQFVLFSETGVYMQIVEEGNGERLKDGRYEILVRYAKNGYYDPVTGEMLEHNPDYLTINQIPFPYYPEDCEQVLQGGENIKKYLASSLPNKEEQQIAEKNESREAVPRPRAARRASPRSCSAANSTAA